MSLIRRCDICKRDIEDGVEFKHVHTRVIAGPVYKDDEDTSFDICSSCWALFMHDIKAKQQRREEAKEADRIFSDPWDSGIMAFKNGERMC